MWNHAPGAGMMGDWGFMGFGLILWLAILVAVIAAVLWFVRSSQSNAPSERHPDGLDILNERYARGEIDREEYLRKKRDLVE